MPPVEVSASQVTLPEDGAIDPLKQIKVASSSSLPKADTPSASDTPSGADGSVRQGSKAKWQVAKKAVMQQHSILSMFKTLRDMHPEDNCDPAWITPVQAAKTKVLGEGAFAVVEKCMYKPPGAVAGRLVAVKRLKPELLSNQEELEQFLAETALLRKLKCRHIVEYVGVGGKADEASVHVGTAGQPAEEKGSMFLVQELMGGGTLRRKVQDTMSGQDNYSNADALRWALQMAQGLQYLHEAIPSVIHRDLKLENVLLTVRDSATAEAKIADFGLSALLPTKRQEKPGLASSIQRRDEVAAAGDAGERESFNRMQSEINQAATKAQDPARGKDGTSPQFTSLKTGAGAKEKLHMSGKTGSLMYMAPEMYKCLQYDCSVDTFSYGVMLFELFGRVMTMYLVCKQGLPEEFEEYAKQVSKGLRPPMVASIFQSALGPLITDCWAQEAKARPTMAQVVQRLKAIEASGELQKMDSKLCGCTIA